MNKLIVINETFFFHPKLIEKLCETYGDQIKGVFLVTKTSSKVSLNSFLIKNIFKLHLSEILILATINFIYFMKDILFKYFALGKPVSVRSVLKKNNVPIINVKNSLNSDSLVEYISKNNIHIVLSSNPLYFGHKYLKLKKVVFLNRHSSYLPHNGGVLPVFYSVSKKMNFIGATVHLISNKIDAGNIIHQEKIIHTSCNLYDLYEKCFDLSYNLIIKSFETIENNFDYYTNYNPYLANKIQYHTFPEKNDWRKFRENSGKFVKLKNLINLILNKNI